MLYAAILYLVVWFIGWWSWKTAQDERKFWESYTSMYDCSGNGRLWDNPHIQQMADKAVYLPRHNFGDPKGLIDFKKYENWLRCMTVTRAAYLMRSFKYENELFHVHWANKGDSLVMTSITILSIKPKFLATRPRNIWCRFDGGPPDKKSGKCVMNTTSSLLNYIVDRVYRYILHHGVEATDSRIIASLNYVQPLLLDAPCSA